MTVSKRTREQWRRAFLKWQRDYVRLYDRVEAGVSPFTRRYLAFRRERDREWLRQWRKRWWTH